MVVVAAVVLVVAAAVVTVVAAAAAAAAASAGGPGGGMADTNSAVYKAAQDMQTTLDDKDAKPEDVKAKLDGLPGGQDDRQAKT